MGSCISKCKPNKKKKHEIDEIEKEGDVKLQDKLVIVASSENPPLKSPSQKTQNPNSFISPLSPSPSHSSCSSTSFSCSTNLHNSCSSSSSSSSSCSSSVTISKNISTQLLKQNPQIVLLDPAKSRPQPPQKRQRASSPNLTRQKSFRRDPAAPTLSIQAKKPSPLRSPSPSRRFVSNGGAMDSTRVVENFKGNRSLRKGNNNTINNVKRGNLKSLSDPNSRSRRSFRSPSMRKEAEVCSLNRVVSRVDGISIREERNLSCLQDVEMIPLEDLNNPLIALDCFIFL